LEKRLHQSESKYEEMLLSNQDVTTPMLQQIERLEGELRMAKSDWVSQEIVLLKRCQVAEKDRSELQETVSCSSNEHRKLMDRIDSLEQKLHVSKTRQEAIENEKEV
jgi:hypothetical protein